MRAERQPRMPWEEDARELTEEELRDQLARMLATGALQAARRQAPVEQEKQRTDGGGQ